MCAHFGWWNPEFREGTDRARLFRHLARKALPQLVHPGQSRRGKANDPFESRNDGVQGGNERRLNLFDQFALNGDAQPREPFTQARGLLPELL